MIFYPTKIPLTGGNKKILLYRAKFLLFFFLSFISIYSCSIAFAQKAHADISQKDFLTIMRTIGFLQTPPPENSPFIIIYDPQSQISRSEAFQMADIMKENGKTFLPRLVPAPEASQFMDAPLIFLAGGLSQYHENLSSLKNSGSLSFSLDKSCLAQECCAVYINSKNRVEIIVNKALADKLRVPFKPIFLMMVTII